MSSIRNIGDFYQASKRVLEEEATRLRQQLRRGEVSASDHGVVVTLLETRLEERLRDLMYPEPVTEIPFG